MSTNAENSFHVAKDIESQEAKKTLISSPEQRGWNATTHTPPTSDYPPADGCIPCCIYRRRIGNVYILHERVTDDGSLSITCLAPVCWPMVFVSIGFVLGISYFALSFALPQVHWFFSIISGIFLASFVVSLLLTSFRDFGIFPRYHEPRSADWHWSVQSQSFRPPGVFFCSESKVRFRYGRVLPPGRGRGNASHPVA